MKNFSENLVFTIFAFIGIIIIVGGIFLQISNTNFKKTAIKTQAEITDIITRRDSDGDTSHIVYVEFEVNDIKYSGSLGSYSSSMYIGKSIDIYYNPLNPNNFKSSTSTFVGLFVIGFGMIFSLIGGIKILSSISKKRLNKQLLETGSRITAKFDRLEINRSYSVNHKHPYKIVCQGIENDYNEYFSENIWKNPERFIQDKGITHFSIYIDPTNPKKYYMPLDELNDFFKN